MHFSASLSSSVNFHQNAGQMQCPGNFLDEVDADREKVDDILGVHDDGMFTLLQENTYVYAYPLEQQKATSSVSISQWDAFSGIRIVDVVLPDTGSEVDLLPFFLDEIFQRREHEALLKRNKFQV